MSPGESLIAANCLGSCTFRKYRRVGPQYATRSEAEAKADDLAARNARFRYRVAQDRDGAWSVEARPKGWWELRRA